MKKNYETPSVEVIKFQYSDQVVATSCTHTSGRWGAPESYKCDESETTGRTY